MREYVENNVFLQGLVPPRPHSPVIWWLSNQASGKHKRRPLAVVNFFLGYCSFCVCVCECVQRDVFTVNEVEPNSAGIKLKLVDEHRSSSDSLNVLKMGSVPKAVMKS